MALYLLVHEGFFTALSSVPFSFGSDMGDNFIVPCGACRQVMREVTACAGGLASPDPQHLPPKHPEVQREGVVTPLSPAPGLWAPQIALFTAKGVFISLFIAPHPTGPGDQWESINSPSLGVLFLPGAEFDPRSLKMFFFLQKTSPSCCPLPPPCEHPQPGFGGLIF